MWRRCAQAIPDVGKRNVLLAVRVVDEHGVALAECAPPGVLTGEADVDALVHQRADGKRLGERPVDLAARHELVALGELTHRVWDGR